MRYHIDNCSIFRNVVFIIGWTEMGTPTVKYAGQKLAVVIAPVLREDLPHHFGPQSINWGFNLTAILPTSDPLHSEIQLTFPDGTDVVFSGSKFRSLEDQDFEKMTARFTESTKRGGRALEIGSRARSGNSYHHLIDASVDYVGLDITGGENVDVIGDAHHLSRHIQGKFDYVLSISVFEHLLMPWMVALEMNKVMNVGGVAFIQSHPSWPLHEEPWDFWRFSKDAWAGLFNSHTGYRMIDSRYAMGARVVPDFAAGGATQDLEKSRTYLLTACLVEKIGEPKVKWEADAGEVYDLRYNHR